jgi:hypothetical protein
MQNRHWRYKNLYWDYVTKQWEYLTKARPKKGYCKVRGCDNATPLDRNKDNTLHSRPFCDRCKRKRWRVNNPFHYMYSELKRSAKRRGIYFHLHRGEFIQFCLENELYRDSLKFTAASLTVDRIDTELGYYIQNMQVITNSDNVAKRNTHFKNHTKIDEPF